MNPTRGSPVRLALLPLALVCALVCVGAGIALGSVTLAIVGMGCAALWQWIAQKESPRAPQPCANVSVPGIPATGAGQRQGIANLLMLAALGLSLHASQQAWRAPERMGPFVLWLGSLLLISAAAAFYDGWLPSSGAWRGARRGLRSVRAWEWGGIAVAVCVAWALRIYELGATPPFNGDEGAMGERALVVFEGNARLPIFIVDFLGTHPTLFHYLQAASMRLFGADIAGIRMLAVITGVLCVPALYFTARRGWGVTVAMTAMGLLTLSHLHIQYSRMSLNNIQSVLFTILAVWLLVEAWESRSHADGSRIALYVGIGLTTGLAQYFYTGSRLIPIVVVLALAMFRLRRRASSYQLVVAALAAAVAFLPLAWHYAYHPAYFWIRMGDVNLFNPRTLAERTGTNAPGLAVILPVLTLQVQHTLGFFVKLGDASNFYTRAIPGFDPVTATLCWLGFGVTLALFRMQERIILLWLGFGLLLGGVLAGSAPQGTRLVIMAPAACIAAALFVRQLLASASSWNAERLRLRVPRPLVALAGGAVAAGMLWLNARLYFVDYGGNMPDSIHPWIAEVMAEHADTHDSYLIAAPSFDVKHGSLRFLARDAQRFDAANAEAIPVETPDGKGHLVLIAPHRLDELERVAARLPGGATYYITNAVGDLVFAAYALPPAAPLLDPAAFPSRIGRISTSYP